MTYPNNANTYLPGTITIASSLDITAITQDYPMVVTVIVDGVTEANTYQEGQLVKLFIPFGYGMQQANGITARILSVDENDIYLDVNSRGFDPFSVPDTGEMPASLSPAGSRNLQFNNFTNRVPFQSLNNRGN